MKYYIYCFLNAGIRETQRKNGSFTCYNDKQNHKYHNTKESAEKDIKKLNKIENNKIEYFIQEIN